MNLGLTEADLSFVITVVARLKSELQDEGPLPYLVDVVDRTHLTHKDLADHIDRVAVVVYERV